MAGPPVMALPMHFGVTREPQPVHCLFHVRQTRASILTVPNIRRLEGSHCAPNEEHPRASPGPANLTPAPRQQQPQPQPNAYYTHGRTDVPPSPALPGRRRQTALRSRPRAVQTARVIGDLIIKLPQLAQVADHAMSQLAATMRPPEQEVGHSAEQSAAPGGPGDAGFRLTCMPVREIVRLTGLSISSVSSIESCLLPARPPSGSAPRYRSEARSPRSPSTQPAASPASRQPAPTPYPAPRPRRRPCR